MFPVAAVSRMFENFVVAKLYTDHEWVQELQRRLVGKVSAPYYVVMDAADEEILRTWTYEPNPEEFRARLEAGLKVYRALQTN